ncbi:hypothetical protein Droror1_Dr00024465, partial [Drosera rotundifolia]
MTRSRNWIPPSSHNDPSVTRVDPSPPTTTQVNPPAPVHDDPPPLNITEDMPPSGSRPEDREESPLHPSPPTQIQFNGLYSFIQDENDRMMGTMMDRLRVEIQQRMPPPQTTPPRAATTEQDPVTPAPIPPTRTERGKSAPSPTEARRVLHFQGQTRIPPPHHQQEPHIPLVNDFDKEDEAQSFTALENIARPHEAATLRHPVSGPFAPGIHAVPFPHGLKMPYFDRYDGSTDPEDHVNTIEIRMQLYNVKDAIMCRAFPSTFKGAARQ